MVPKCKDSYEDAEPLDNIKNMIKDFYKDKSVNIVQVDYEPTLVSYFLGNKVLMSKSKVFEKKYNVMCKFCEYQIYCRTNGKDMSEIVVEDKKEEEPEMAPVELF